METVKNLLAATILISMLSACGCDNNSGTVTTSPSPTTAATDRPNTTNDANNNMENAADSAGNAVEDAGNAVGNTVEGVTDAVGNAMDGNNR